jgi:hypothetical protein
MLLMHVNCCVNRERDFRQAVYIDAEAIHYCIVFYFLFVKCYPDAADILLTQNILP